MNSEFLMYGLVAALVVAVFALWLRSVHARPRGSPFLYIEQHSRVIAYPITKKVTHIGRHRDNDIVLSDKTVSRFHSKILRGSQGDFFIVDKNSTNHTQVGAPVETARLYEGVEIVIGSVALRFSSKPRDSEDDTEERSLPTLAEDLPPAENGLGSVSVTVRFHHQSTGWKVGSASDLNTDGMFIATSHKEIELGSTVEIILPTDAAGRVRWLRFKGIVARHTKYGFGISFTDLDDSSREALQEFERVA